MIRLKHAMADKDIAPRLEHINDVFSHLGLSAPDPMIVGIQRFGGINRPEIGQYQIPLPICQRVDEFCAATYTRKLSDALGYGTEKPTVDVSTLQTMGLNEVAEKLAL